ncbi:peptidoglycan DD-metalloendopeptidase family protein [[Pseudomonas] boreopolis]|uniref:peptidoglycan DD-metalloendopeptidase family protein n=1 Tax=Xanthomonas boreopolis TaxID=86183 RepID=UPI003DA13F90
MVEPLFGGGQAWAQTVEYIHTDALGSPVAVTDANGNVIERTVYEPYGAQVNRAVMDGPGYTGHVSDAATGLSYMQQRYYDPGIGRFLSRDPMKVNPSTGAGFNPYAYAANNPYRFKDPDGRCERPTGSNICARSTLTSTVTRTMLPVEGKVDMAKTQRSWPVPGYTKLNEADKPREGRGEFGSPRNTARGRSTHTGIDIEAPTGARVVAAADGAVVDIKPNPSTTYGNQVVIDHGDGVFTQSAHLDTVLVKPGVLVNGGQDIGTVGRTGNTPALGDSHLHFETRLNSSAPRAAGGTVFDPMQYLPEPGGSQ